MIGRYLQVFLSMTKTCTGISVVSRSMKEKFYSEISLTYVSILYAYMPLCRCSKVVDMEYLDERASWSCLREEYFAFLQCKVFSSVTNWYMPIELANILPDKQTRVLPSERQKPFSHLALVVCWVPREMRCCQLPDWWCLASGREYLQILPVEVGWNESRVRRTCQRSWQMFKQQIINEFFDCGMARALIFHQVQCRPWHKSAFHVRPELWHVRGCRCWFMLQMLQLVVLWM